MVNLLKKLSLSQTQKARLGYVWRGIWSTAVTVGLGIPFFFLLQTDKPIGGSYVLRIFLWVLTLPLLVSWALAGSLVGGVIGIGVGIVQAMTRQPRVFDTPHDLSVQLSKISRDGQSHTLIKMVIQEYEAKNGAHSLCSKALLKQLKTDHDIEQKMKWVRDYLVEYDQDHPAAKIFSPLGNFGELRGAGNPSLADNKGKRLYNILCDKIMCYEEYPKREIRKNTQIFADLKRRGHPCFKDMPKDILLMMASMTNPFVDQDGNPIPAPSRNGEAPNPRMTDQEALEIATTTYNNGLP